IRPIDIQSAAGALQKRVQQRVPEPAVAVRIPAEAELDDVREKFVPKIIALEAALAAAAPRLRMIRARRLRSQTGIAAALTDLEALVSGVVNHDHRPARGRNGDEFHPTG